MADAENDNSQRPDVRPTPRCAICGSAVVAAFRPFCSPRCADTDLSRWLNGAYAIPVTQDSDEDGDQKEHYGESVPHTAMPDDIDLARRRRR